MCGIAGFTHRDGRPRPELIRQATYSLVHRGPDQQGVWESPWVSLGAARLKILDLDAGDQPLKSEDGRIVVVFNGEIYNFRELGRALEQRGHCFRTRCDTEVLLKAFLEWDLECLPRLRGMFAFAVWCEPERRLVLVRDRMGIKPLYLCRLGEDLIFGSELKALFVHPDVERRLDLAGLDAYLSLNYVPGTRTLVKGIEKLPPGEWLEWRDGRVQRGNYWQLRLNPDPSWTPDSAKEALDALLRAAVREHLTADVPLGVWASGGLDSSTILHYAAGVGLGRLRTFSVSFPGRSFDESRYFRRVAAWYGAEHEEYELVPTPDLAGVIEQLVYFGDEPGADAGAVPLWYLSRLCRRRVTVVLSGEGADELFGGYLTYLADRLARPLRRLPRPVRRLASSVAGLWPVSDEKIGFDYKLKRFLEGTLLPADQAHLYWNGTFSSREKQSLWVRESPSGVRPAFLDILGRPEAPAGSLNRYLWLDQLCYLPDDILYKCDRVSMAHSLEVRPPFLDHRIVEFAASLPPRFKVRGTCLKWILRELMKDKLPPEVIRRRKEGLDIPVHEWLRGPLREMLLETLNRTTVSELGVLAWEPVSNCLTRHLERRANLGYHLWGLMTLVLWLRTWKIRAAPEEVFSEEKQQRIAARHVLL